MKRLAAVCVIAGILLATSTAAFATPVTIWDQTKTVNITATFGGTIIWEQPFSIDPGYTITEAKLTIVANDVDRDPAGLNRYENDLVSRGPTSTGAWTSTGVYLTQQGADLNNADTTTVIALGAPAWLTGNFFVKVQLDTSYGGWTATVKTSRLEVKAEPPPVIPAPGAILLASLGAGLVSWLRTRKAL